MAGTVYALVVGINDYRPPLSALYGCLNDVDHLTEYLQNRLGDRLQLRVLRDQEAPYAGVVEAFRAQLGQAGPDDVALFCFSGHGSEEPAPTQFVHLEPSGRIQTLMCWDSGRRVEGKLVRGLADKELATLIGEVAARGTHVAVLLDCCHSGSGTRDEAVTFRQWLPQPDLVDEEYRGDVTELRDQPRADDEFVAGTADQWASLATAVSRDAGTPAGTQPVDHVALSACQSFEVAKEQPFEGTIRGAFTVGLLDSLRALGPDPTYRSLLATIRSRVGRSTSEQTPVLYPVDDGGPADTTFLGGAGGQGSAGLTMTKGESGWVVDGGLIHGLSPPGAEGALRIACLASDGSVAGWARVTSVGPTRSDVEPDGWLPDDVAYPVVLGDFPVARAMVTFDAGSDPGACDRVRAALKAAGPGGGPSPFVVEGTGEGLPLRVAAFADGYRVESDRGGAVDSTEERAGPCLRVLRADGTPVGADIPGLDDAAAAAAVGVLEHVARWEQLRTLADAGSARRSAVRLEVVPAEPGEEQPPDGRDPVPDADGVRLSYRRVGDTWEPPNVFLQLRSTADRDLWVALLAYNSRYGLDVLLPAERLAPGALRWVFDGAPIPVELPAGAVVEPGASVQDWLQLIVSDDEFTTPAPLPALGQPIPAPETSREGGGRGRARSTGCSVGPRGKLRHATATTRPLRHRSGPWSRSRW